MPNLKCDFCGERNETVDTISICESCFYTRGKWISVKDMLPDKGQPVLTFNQEDYQADLYTWFGDCYGVNFLSDIFKEDGDFKVTHWMQLPEMPEEEV